MSQTFVGPIESSGPLVTVIIIAFNGARWIETAAKSVLSQSYKNFELIVIEDGSRDGTEALILGLCDPRTRYHWRTNGGPSAARNSGIAMARGDFIAFLDCDDQWTSNKLRAQVELLSSSPHYGWVYSGAIRMDEKGVLLGRHHPEVRGKVLPNLLYENRITGSASSVLVRRDILLAAGCFNERVASAEDWECWLRLAAISQVGAVADLDVLLLSRASSFGKNTARLRADILQFLDDALSTYAVEMRPMRRKIRAHVEATTSVDYSLSGVRFKAVSHILRAIALRPLHLPYIKRLLLILAGKK